MDQKVLFITQEISPYVADSTMSTLGRKLPSAAMANGCDIRTFMPKWGHVNERRNQLHEVIRLSGVNISINEVDHPLLIKVASIQSSHMQVYFIDNADYFKGRLMRVNEEGAEYADNVERAIFYARGVLDTVKKLRWFPDIVVCEGWMSYIIPFYIRTAYREEPAFANSKIVSTIFREQLTDAIPQNIKECINYREASIEQLEQTGIDFSQQDALVRLAVGHSDCIINVAAPKEIGAIIDEGECIHYKLKSLDNLQEQFADICSKL